MWSKFKKIKDTKKIFYKKVLSSNKGKCIWKIIHQILQPNNAILNANVNDLNKFFNTTAKRILDKTPKTLHDLKHNQK